jgi:uncharacterized protein DUF4404
MEEPTAALRAKLEQLDAEIQRTGSVDEAGREILFKLQADVRDLLARSGGSTGSAVEQDLSIAERLRQGIQHFEVTHPNLTGLMEEVVNTLSGMGF